jgi:hypothetical protein
MSRARRDDLEVIELVDADPAAFGGAPVAVVSDDAGEPRPTRRRREPPRGVPAWMMGLAVVLLIVAAGTVAWKLSPWHADDSVFVRDQRATPTLTNHLIVGDLHVVPLASYVGASAAEPVERTNVITSGAVFVGPRSTPSSTPPSMLFWRIPPGTTFSDESNDGSSKIEVQGQPGTIMRGSGEYLIRWGLPDGSQDNLRALSVDEGTATRLADNISIDRHDTVFVRHRSALGAFHAAGTVNDLQTAGSTFTAAAVWATDPGSIPPSNLRSVDLIDYGPLTLAVGPSTGSDPIELLRPNLPAATALQVHGHDALAVQVNTDSAASPSAGLNYVVVWVEGGLTIAVAGNTLSATLQNAEAVRPATDAEWQQVVKVQNASTTSPPTNSLVPVTTG